MKSIKVYSQDRVDVCHCASDLWRTIAPSNGHVNKVWGDKAIVLSSVQYIHK